MKLTVTIGVLSVVGAAFMIRSALAVGFGVFVGPIVLAEVIFLAALYALWRGFGGERDVETVEVARPAPDRRATPDARPGPASRPAPPVGLGGRSLVGRTGS